MSDETAREPATDRPTGWPAWVFVLALLAAAVHISPFLLASTTPPAGWEFTGNMSSLSPDAMQYRVWFEETFHHGFLAVNRFTPEANSPHLPLLYFATVGQLAKAFGMVPMVLSEILGAVWAFGLTLLVFAAARRFCPRPADLRLVVPLALLGGGLSAHVLLLEHVPGLGHRGFIQKNLVRPAEATAWEVYRGNYTYQAIFDTHSGLQWLLALASLLLFHDLLRGRAGPVRVVATIALYVLTAAIHLYTGLILIAITAGVVLVCGMRRVAWPGALRHGVLLAAAGAVTIGGLLLALRSGGLPLSPWRAPVVTLAAVLLAYPLTAAVLVRDGKRLFADRGLESTFLLGWAGACLLILLSGPYFPYPDRGAITAQLPLTFLAANLWFGAGRRLTRGIVLVVVLVAAPSFLRALHVAHHRVRFRETVPPVYMGPEHRRVAAELRTAGSDDLLLARQRESLWLAPEHPGRHYCGHFFLTVDHGAKLRELETFFGRPAELGADWLRARGIDLVYVAAGDEVDLDGDGAPDAGPERFDDVAGLDVRIRTEVGTLYRVAEAGR